MPEGIKNKAQLPHELKLKLKLQLSLAKGGIVTFARYCGSCSRVFRSKSQSSGVSCTDSRRSERTGLVSREFPLERIFKFSDEFVISERSSFGC